MTLGDPAGYERVEQGYETLVTAVVRTGRPDLLMAAFAAGYDRKQPNRHEQTPLELAAGLGHGDLAALLLTQYDPADLFDGTWDHTVLGRAAREAARAGHPVIAAAIGDTSNRREVQSLVHALQPVLGAAEAAALPRAGTGDANSTPWHRRHLLSVDIRPGRKNGAVEYPVKVRGVTALPLALTLGLLLQTAGAAPVTVSHGPDGVARLHAPANTLTAAAGEWGKGIAEYASRLGDVGLSLDTLLAQSTRVGNVPPDTVAFPNPFAEGLALATTNGAVLNAARKARVHSSLLTGLRIESAGGRGAVPATLTLKADELSHFLDQFGRRTGRR